jgi:hypothetical protein
VAAGDPDMAADGINRILDSVVAEIKSLIA